MKLKCQIFLSTYLMKFLRTNLLSIKQMKHPFLIIYLFPLALWAQAPAGITFPVETLTPHKGPLPQVPLPAGDTFYRPGLDSLVCGSEGMGLYQTVKMAFSGHYPLVLSPDLVWGMIARGIAQHIQANPDSLRALVVDHAGPEKCSSHGW